MKDDEKMKPMDISGPKNQPSNGHSTGVDIAPLIEGKGIYIIVVSAFLVIAFIFQFLTTHKSVIQNDVKPRQIDLMPLIQRTTDSAIYLRKLCTMQITTPEIVSDGNINVNYCCCISLHLIIVI